MDAPFCISNDAKVWRKSWNRTCRRIFAALNTTLMRFCWFDLFQAFPSERLNRRSSLDFLAVKLLMNSASLSVRKMRLILPVLLCTIDTVLSRGSYALTDRLHSSP